MSQITIAVDLPPDITAESYERIGDNYGFSVSWPLPSHCQCDRCHREEEAHISYRSNSQVIRDLDILGSITFWIYQSPYHRCPRCGYRQDLIPPFKRKDVKYTLRFEAEVLRLMIGGTEEDTARRLGISAETVHAIVANQVNDFRNKEVDPNRVILDVGIDELSLKKGHKLYATILTDLTDPAHPQVLAVSDGRDEAAGRKCLEKLSETQLEQIRTYRADMGPAYHKACRELLPNAQAVVDRFHVAKLFNEAIDQQRKKLTHAYKEKLTKAERKEFRSQMWEFRRNPNDLTEEEKQKLEVLFQRLPGLRSLYDFRVRFQAIFDRTWDRKAARSALQQLFFDMLDECPELDRFIRTFEHWEEPILNYFDARQTSGQVEGINNKARVILKRAYGLRLTDSLWTRLILDLNRSKDVVRYTIGQIRGLVSKFRDSSSYACA